MTYFFYHPNNSPDLRLIWRLRPRVCVFLRAKNENATPNFCFVSCAVNRRDFLRFHLCRHTFASLWGASIRCASLWHEWWFVVMRSCLRKALFIFFLFVFALKGFFIFFLVGAAFATFFLARELVFNGIYFVKLDENIGDCPFTSGLFTVFLPVNSILRKSDM